MSQIQLRLLNDFQRDFPLTAHPFQDIADALGMRVDDVLDTLRRLLREGIISRVGAVFRPNRIGVSTLAAMAVPAQRLDDFARVVSGYPEVNHNYEREHPFNLWFVVTAPNAVELGRVIEDIERRAGLPVMRLPMLEDYHIDLAFDLSARVAHGPSGRAAATCEGRPTELEPPDYALIAEIQDGIPLVSRPYAAIGATIGMGEQEVLRRLQGLVDQGVIKRMGIVVRHHELGFRANAMVVWDIPDAEVAEVGRRIGASGLVNLCYRRPRRLPEWPYNLFCMIHGKDREGVLEQLELLKQQHGLHQMRYAVLFSGRRFKQTGARYVQRVAPAKVA